jgi:hypothetical protein
MTFVLDTVLHVARGGCTATTKLKLMGRRRGSPVLRLLEPIWSSQVCPPDPPIRQWTVTTTFPNPALQTPTYPPTNPARERPRFAPIPHSYFSCDGAVTVTVSCDSTVITPCSLQGLNCHSVTVP